MIIEDMDNERMEWISIDKELPPQDGTPFLCFDPKQIDNFVNATIRCLYPIHQNNNRGSDTPVIVKTKRVHKNRITDSLINCFPEFH